VFREVHSLNKSRQASYSSKIIGCSWCNGRPTFRQRTHDARHTRETAAMIRSLQLTGDWFDLPSFHPNTGRLRSEAGKSVRNVAATRLGLRSHRHECESESEFPFTGCLSVVQASPARVERSRSFVQAHKSTRVYWQSPVKSNRANALRKK